MKGSQPEEHDRISDQGGNHTTMLEALTNFMPYRNDPVRGEGPFYVVVAFGLELNVVHTPRLQRKPRRHFSRKRLVTGNLI